MKKHLFILVTAIFSILFLISCEERNDNSIFWGQTYYYSDFLSKKYKPVRMEQTLVFEFNEDAIKHWDNVIHFELVDINTKKRIDEVILYKNGTACKDNFLEISTSDNEVVVGIEFLPTAHEGRYMLALQPESLNGLDRIDAIELGNGIVLEKENIMNPLAKGMTLGFIALAIMLIVWIVIMHLFVNPRTYFNRVTFDYGSGEGRPIRMGSAYKLVCTNNSKKISFFKKLFVGDIKYEVNDFWENELVITNGIRNKQIRFVGKASYDINPDMVMKGDKFTVTNNKGEEVNIQL